MRVQRIRHFRIRRHRQSLQDVIHRHRQIGRDRSTHTLYISQMFPVRHLILGYSLPRRYPLRLHSNSLSLPTIPVNEGVLRMIDKYFVHGRHTRDSPAYREGETGYRSYVHADDVVVAGAGEQEAPHIVLGVAPDAPPMSLGCIPSARERRSPGQGQRESGSVSAHPASEGGDAR